MAKKKPAKARSRTEDRPAKTVLYVEVPLAIKEAMERLRKRHDRTLTGEVIQALKKHLSEHGLWSDQLE